MCIYLIQMYSIRMHYPKVHYIRMIIHSAGGSDCTGHSNIPSTLDCRRESLRQQQQQRAGHQLCMGYNRSELVHMGKNSETK